MLLYATIELYINTDVCSVLVGVIEHTIHVSASVS